MAPVHNAAKNNTDVCDASRSSLSSTNTRLTETRCDYEHGSIILVSISRTGSSVISLRPSALIQSSGI